MTSGHLLRYTVPGMWITLCLCAGAQPDAAPVSLPDFTRYDVILDRKPFGVETLPQIQVQPTVPPDQSFTAKFKMAAVTRDDNGVLRVGLVDLKSKQSSMLGVGDSIEGVEVVEADYIKERARLRRPPEDYWVSMAGGSNSYEAVAAGPAPVAHPVAAPATATAAANPRAKAGLSSYAARREARLRKELQQIQAIEALHAKESKTTDATSVASVRASRPKTDASGKAAPMSDTGQALLRLLKNTDNADLSPEEVNSLLQEYQKELIRTGQTPLPIPLTPETDQELVNEGVLPATQ